MREVLGSSGWRLRHSATLSAAYSSAVSSSAASSSAAYPAAASSPAAAAAAAYSPTASSLAAYLPAASSSVVSSAAAASSAAAPPPAASSSTSSSFGLLVRRLFSRRLLVLRLPARRLLVRRRHASADVPEVEYASQCPVGEAALLQDLARLCPRDEAASRLAACRERLRVPPVDEAHPEHRVHAGWVLRSRPPVRPVYRKVGPSRIYVHAAYVHGCDRVHLFSAFVPCNRSELQPLPLGHALVVRRPLPLVCQVARVRVREQCRHEALPAHLARRRLRVH